MKAEKRSGRQAGKAGSKATEYIWNARRAESIGTVKQKDASKQKSGKAGKAGSKAATMFTSNRIRKFWTVQNGKRTSHFALSKTIYDLTIRDYTSGLLLCSR